jgi:hypothetical protein
MPGDYSENEITRMNPTDFAEAQARGWKRSVFIEHDVTPKTANTWAANRDSVGTGEEFTAPSGQKCLLRRLDPEELMRLGILDRITRLEGLAQSLVDQAEGLPPEKVKLPDRADLELLLETIDLLLPHAVLEPRIYANDDDEAPEDAIRVSHVDLDDRVAIMEHSVRKLKMMDRFRHAR